MASWRGYGGITDEQEGAITVGSTWMEGAERDQSCSGKEAMGVSYPQVNRSGNQRESRSEMGFNIWIDQRLLQ